MIIPACQEGQWPRTGRLGTISRKSGVRSFGVSTKCHDKTRRKPSGGCLMSRFVTLLLCLWVIGAVCVAERIEAAANQPQPLVLLARLEDEPITPSTAQYLKRAVRQAEEQHAECLVVVLDTPGGLLDATRSIVKSILGSHTCVVVYVAPICKHWSRWVLSTTPPSFFPSPWNCSPLCYAGWASPTANRDQ